MTPALVGAATIEANRRMAVARLAHEALAPYYDRLCIPAGRLLAVLADEAGDPCTELGTGRATLEAGQVAGIVVAYPVLEMPGRQQASLFHLLRSGIADGDVVMAAAEAQAAAVPPIVENSCYLARIAVAEAHRGTGLAEHLLLAAEDGLAPSVPIALHVHRDNERAIRFYRRHGYVRSDGFDLPFQSFVRHR